MFSADSQLSDLNQSINMCDKYTDIYLEPDYEPCQDEEYMSDKQLAYFLRKLITWKQSLQQDSAMTLSHLREENWNESDPSDRATIESDIGLELRSRDRLRKLIDQIDLAIVRIKNGTYGYCEETGDEIGVKRLMARPIARMCLEAQEKHEKFERVHNDLIVLDDMNDV